MSEELPSRMFERLIGDADEREARARTCHRELIERGKGSDRVFVEALSDIDRSIQISNERSTEMGEWIRANTSALLSVLNRLDDLRE